jgi:site-specific recombinase XerD
MTPTLAHLLQRFLGHHLPIHRGLAANTVLAYRDTLKLLLCYAADRLRKPVDKLLVEDLKEPLVLAFLEYLEKQRDCSARTRNVRLAAIRTFFGFAAREEPALLVQAQIVRTIPLKRTSYPTIDYLEETEMQALLDAVDLRSRTGIRDRALLLLLYNTGARVSEIVHLALPDLRLDSVPQVKLLGKGRKTRICPLWPETTQDLQAYLPQRHPKAPAVQQLFLDANGRPITRFGIRHVIGKYAAQAHGACPSIAAKTITPHTIRHTTAMHLLRAGNDINMVSYWLGHADINTTHVYAEIDMTMKRQMIEKADAPALSKPRPWKKPAVLEWLNRLAAPAELCEVKQA